MTTGSRFAIEQLSAVSNTALLTLWARAIDARSPDPILPDPQAVALLEQLHPQVAAMPTPLHQQLAAAKIPPMLVKLLAVRAQHMDQTAREFLLRFPRGIIVNLGAGLDTRFARLNSDSDPSSSRVRVIDIDLPAMVALKHQLLAPHPRHELIAASALDFAWMDALDRYDDCRFLFIAEGLLAYFTVDEVRGLLVTMATRFPGSEFAADVFNAVWLRPPWRTWTMRKMQRRLNFDPDAVLQFGLDSPQKMASWDPRLQYIRMWSLFDSQERKLGSLRWLRYFPLTRMVQYVVHYQLG